jgi:hypothetical protein
MASSGNGENPNGAALFEAANKLRGSVDSAEYKHLVLGLLFPTKSSASPRRRPRSTTLSPEASNMSKPTPTSLRSHTSWSRASARISR